MCQMPNFWHIYHTKHKKHQISDVPNSITFTTCIQYRCKFATVRNQNGIILIIFYSLFSLLSPLFSLYPFLFCLTSILSHRFPLFSATPIPFVLSFPFNLRSVWRWPLSPEAQAAWVTSSPLVAHEPSSSLSHRHRSLISLSLSLFWWLAEIVVVIVVGWLRFVDRRWCGLRCGFWVDVDVGFDVGFGSALMWVSTWVLGRRWCGFWVGVVGVRFGMGEGWWRLLRMI